MTTNTEVQQGGELPQDERAVISTILRDVCELEYNDDFDEKEMLAVTTSDLTLIITRALAQRAAGVPGRILMADGSGRTSLKCYSTEEFIEFWDRKGMDDLIALFFHFQEEFSDAKELLRLVQDACASDADLDNIYASVNALPHFYRDGIENGGYILATDAIRLLLAANSAEPQPTEKP
jgi:hypothetical protein